MSDSIVPFSKGFELDAKTETETESKDASTIFVLPNEIMLLIFQYLQDVTKLNILPYVCVQWRTISSSMISELNISKLQSDVFNLFSMIEIFKNANSLIIDVNSLLHLDRFPLYRRFSKITKLSYFGNRCDYGLRNIAAMLFLYFKELTSIKIEFSYFSTRDLEAIIVSNSNITSINLWYTQVNMLGFITLIKRGYLTSLKKLKYNSEYFSRYRYVDKQVCNEFFIAISMYCPNMEWLDVRNTGITNEGLMSLSACKNLQHLNIKKSYRLIKKDVKSLNKKLPNTHIIFK